MSLVEKFVPSIDVLFEQDLSSQEDRPMAEIVIKDLLLGWGILSSSETKHLGYSRPKWDFKRKEERVVPNITPDEFDLIDKAMSRVLGASPELFEVLKWRYYFRAKIGHIAANVLRMSPRTAGRRLSIARMAFYNALAVEYGSDSRYPISPDVIDSALLEKVN